MRATVARTRCTAGKSRPTRTAMMAMTTSSSISVKARGWCLEEQFATLMGLSCGRVGQGSGIRGQNSLLLLFCLLTPGKLLACPGWLEGQGLLFARASVSAEQKRQQAVGRPDHQQHLHPQKRGAV